MTHRAGSGGSLRVLTGNLLHDRIDAAAFGRILDRTGPDIVAVQELGSAAAGEIEARFEHHCLRPEVGPSGMGLAVRHPAGFGEVRLGGIPAIESRLDPESWPSLPSRLHVIGIHLANPVDWPQWEMIGLRRRQVRRLAAQVAGSPHALVVGDCNATPLWPAYRRIREVLDDGVLAAARGGPRPRRTWGPFPGGPKLLRIDHVFVRGVTVTTVERIDLPGSDHAGLVADISMEAAVAATPATSPAPAMDERRPVPPTPIRWQRPRES